MNMTFTLEVQCDNAAFEDNDEELVGILLKVAASLKANTLWKHEEGGEGNLFDSNGNHVGGWSMA